MSLDIRRVFIGNIPYSASLSDIHEYMSKAGKVKKIYLFRDESGSSKGYGTVEYYSSLDAQEAVSRLHLSLMSNRPLTVKLDNSFCLLKKKPVSTQIKISNIPPYVTWQQLKDVCREIGSVQRVDIVEDVGFAKFFKLEDAREAVLQLNGAIFNDQIVKACFYL